VLIAAASALPALRERAGADGVELLAFTDVETLRALAAITSRRPSVVALDRLFAATPRGAALINRIKADPSLASSEIRVISPDRTAAIPQPAPVVVETAPPALPSPPAAAPSAAAGTAEPPAPAPTELDEHGTRRAPRQQMKVPDITVDGAVAALIDLNAMGAQVLSQGVLKPNQKVRMTFSDGQVPLRVLATVVWATFEIPPGIGPRYRAGIEFADEAARTAIADYVKRNL